MDMQKIMGRIRKLLAIAEDTRANPNEAAAAAHQAQTLMQKFQIDNADILLAKAQRAEGEEFATVDVAAKMKRNVDNGHKAMKLPQWASWIAVRTAQLNDCNVIIANNPQHGAVARFQGFAADAQVAGWMYDYLLNCLIADLRRWQRAAARQKADSAAYRTAYALELCRKLLELDAARRADMTAASASAGALVVAKGNAVAAHFGAAKYGKSKSNAGTSGSADAWHDGRAAGNRVDVNRRGLGNSTSAAFGRQLLGN